MRRFYCAVCRATVKFSPTNVYEELQGRKYRLYTCDTCMYRLHVEVGSA